MTAVSGIACVLGSSIICIDVLVRLFPGKRGFKIQDSHGFLSASLSLSFGVMLFSALYSMLPSANASLKRAGFAPRPAAYLVIGCFIGGVIAIQILSRFLHRYIPSEIVDCDHVHEDSGEEEGKDHHDHHDYDKTTHHSHNAPVETPTVSNQAMEQTPLLLAQNGGSKRPLQTPNQRNRGNSESIAAEYAQQYQGRPAVPNRPRRPSFTRAITRRVSSLVFGEHAACGNDGPCYGYSDPWAHQRFRRVPLTLAERKRSLSAINKRNLQLTRSATAPFMPNGQVENCRSADEEYGARDSQYLSLPGESRHGEMRSCQRARSFDGDHLLDASWVSESEDERVGKGGDDATSLTSQELPSHHHHVPTNAFLSIGLQTSIAIALHKLPEGFITYATNHANPKLGFAVFMAIFIHNITEGFAMALPLYLALGSRWQAMFWSSLLGGVSQPLGAGVAALWLKLAGSGNMAPGEGIYGGMFAVTSGVMTSVALQLFSESLGLCHNRAVCIVFAFVGMAILGVSFALTAE